MRHCVGYNPPLAAIVTVFHLVFLLPLTCMFVVALVAHVLSKRFWWACLSSSVLCATGYLVEMIWLAQGWRPHFPINWLVAGLVSFIIAMFVGWIVRRQRSPLTTDGGNVPSP